MVYLSPEPSDAIQHLQLVINSALQLGSGKKKSFVAHLTLGEWSNVNTASNAVAELEQTWSGFEWPVENVLLMSRDPDPFRVKAIVWLGTGKCEVARDEESLCHKLWGCDYSTFVGQDLDSSTGAVGEQVAHVTAEGVKDDRVQKDRGRRRRGARGKQSKQSDDQISPSP